MRAVVVGPGAVGRRAVATLAADPTFDSVVLVARNRASATQAVGTSDPRIEVRQGSVSDFPAGDVTVIAVSTGERKAALIALEQGSHVICATDDPSQVSDLLALDSRAVAAGRSVAVGTVMAPGLSCVLAARLASRFDRIDEVHVASFGTGGPDCARRHHAARTGVAVDWEDGGWRRRPGGSGRELVWFPEPVGGADCYRAALADATLLAPAFPGVRRVTSRLEATRRDRLTSWLPMLREPHPEGLVGAVRVEVRGWIDGRAETQIIGAAVAPAVAAALVSATAARLAVAGALARPGAAGLAQLVTSPGAFLRDLASLGLTVAAFEGR